MSTAAEIKQLSKKILDEIPGVAEREIRRIKNCIIKEVKEHPRKIDFIYRLTSQMCPFHHDAAEEIKSHLINDGFFVFLSTDSCGTNLHISLE